MRLEPVENFGGDLDAIRIAFDSAAADYRVHVVARTEGEIERVSEILQSTRVAGTGRLSISVGCIHRGFRLLEERTLVVGCDQLFHRGELRRVPRRRLGKAIDSFMDLREGDLVVHLAHGIGRYRGLRVMQRAGSAEEHLEIEFAQNTKLYVPTTRIDLVQKYIGGTKVRPRLSQIGGKTWVRQKKAAEEAVTDMAAEMLELQAARMSRSGIAMKADTPWQLEFEHAFPYQETRDQAESIHSVKADLEVARPMDRLICGDVGFGKTEIAMRGAFKAVENGYQVAVLVPTTVLAEQHYNTFRERMAEFPLSIAKLSRFCSPEERRANLKGIKEGSVDIVIGTHRLASKDVQFANLGLVVIDEEQRFGVAVKERLKANRPNVDVLTLSATPIPRTLHMSLVGVRDISNLESPPEDRVSVETRVTRWSDELIRHAILRELNRGGQIYFVHNRVKDIGVIEHRLQHIVPELRIGIGHAQMSEQRLERVMRDFINHKFDLLLATTIIESGLDIPNANTIFIDEADRYGLADLHQLRGRVGRYKHQAYAYLLIDPRKHVNPTAAKRLRAIEEYSQMGAGFAIAMRDLEIRGAGNLLGTEQSGHIAAVGYELYCQLLERAVRSLRQMPPKLSLHVDIDLPHQAFLPPDYVTDPRQRIDLYRRLTRVESYDQLGPLRDELLDRFGELPPEARRLFEIAELRLDAAVWQIDSIFLDQGYLVFKCAHAPRLEQLKRSCKRTLRVVDEHSGYLKLEGERSDPDSLLAVVKSVLRPSA
ncbi:MAG: transcription-repair coupling factor [Pirellulaceae bacterium]